MSLATIILLLLFCISSFSFRNADHRQYSGRMNNVEHLTCHIRINYSLYVQHMHIIHTGCLSYARRDNRIAIKLSQPFCMHIIYINVMRVMCASQSAVLAWRSHFEPLTHKHTIFVSKLNKRWLMRLQHNTLSAYHHQINSICPIPHAVHMADFIE